MSNSFLDISTILPLNSVLLYHSTDAPSLGLIMSWFSISIVLSAQYNFLIIHALVISLYIECFPYIAFRYNHHTEVQLWAFLSALPWNSGQYNLDGCGFCTTTHKFCSFCSAMDINGSSGRDVQPIQNSLLHYKQGNAWCKKIWMFGKCQNK